MWVCFGQSYFENDHLSGVTTSRKEDWETTPRQHNNNSHNNNNNNNNDVTAPMTHNGIVGSRGGERERERERSESGGRFRSGTKRLEDKR